jgi:hypothetical protein
MAAIDREARPVERVVLPHRHICAFFNNKEEKRRALLPFILDGIALGDKVIRLVQQSDRDEINRRLRGESIDIEAAEKRGQLEVVAWPKLDLGNGFNPDGTLELIDHILATAHRQGYSRVRLFGDWALEGQVYADDFICLEASLNTTLSKYPDLIICTYELSHVTGSAVVSALRTHPIAIVGGILQQNPFYVPPEQILEEIRMRKVPN